MILKTLLTFAIALTLTTAGMTEAAQAGILRKFIVARTLVAAEKRWAANTAKQIAAKKLASRASRNFAKEMLAPVPRSPGFKALSKTAVSRLEARVASRTASRSEVKTLLSNERFKERRDIGVREFWTNESKNLKAGLPGTRVWNPIQKRSIVQGGRPSFQDSTIQGHHLYSARKYPQLADNPRNIYPATSGEHLQRWHGGSMRNPTDGTPRLPRLPERF